MGWFEERVGLRQDGSKIQDGQHAKARSGPEFKNKIKIAAHVASRLLNSFLQTPLMMFKFLKQIFRKREKVSTAAAAAPTPSTISKPGIKSGEAAPGVEVASLSLRAILDRLPADLKSGINQMPEHDVKVILPVNAILKQLPTGTVKMSLGSLYRQAPQGTFRKTNVEDKRMVDVPLNEIFKTINPARLHRRNDQKSYAVPEEVQGLFGDGRTRAVAVPGQPSAPAQENQKVLRMPGVTPETGANGGGSSNGSPSGYRAPASSAPKPTPTPTQNPAPKPSKVLPPMPPGVAPEPLNLTGELTLLLVEIGASWPEGARSELSVLTGDTKVVLPVSEVSGGLQKGKVAFTWAQIRNWLKPAPSSPLNIPDDTVLVLPLKIVAPAFVAATGARKRDTGAGINQALPDFFGPSAGRAPSAEAPKPAAPAAPEPAAPAPLSMETPAPAPALKMPAPAPAVENMALSKPASAPAPVATPITLAAFFNRPEQTEWSPQEIVRLTLENPAVIGAVVALEEGLVVAQTLPEGLSAETFAAFMPQVFSRLDKYTGEMQLGDTHEVTLNTAGGPCRMFRRGKMFFATLGRVGETLPAGLHLVADELAKPNS
jgi:predicted regulator of Ras-like GTPase activity (Roadblock/LC7/MglB family)